MPPHPNTFHQDQGNFKYWVYVVYHNNHFYTVNDPYKGQARMRESLSFYGAILQPSPHIPVCSACNARVDVKVTKKANDKGNAGKSYYKCDSCSKFVFLTEEEVQRRKHLAKGPTVEAQTELFREFQHLQPDSKAIDAALEKKFGYDPHSKVMLKAVKVENGQGKAWSWMPRGPETSRQPMYIAAKGLEYRCKELKIDPKDEKAVADNMEAILAMKDAFPEAVFTMANVVAMDIETGSIEGSGGHFLPYAIGWRHGDEKEDVVARTSEDLRGGLMKQALEAWVKYQQALPKLIVFKKGKEILKEPKLYVFAHNGSRFDAVEVLHSILAQDCLPDDFLKSNGKIISFSYKNIVFRCSCLIVMSSLKAAGIAYNVPTPKLSLPHGYLQNCSSEEELLRRLHGDITWKELEPYMDWFSDTKKAELQVRVFGRTWEQWRDAQPLRQQFLKDCENDKPFNFWKDKGRSYLGADFDCLWEILAAMGKQR